jgi:hypothetical protein
MSRQPESAFRATLSGSVRWMLLALGTAGALALVAVAGGEPPPAGPRGPTAVDAVTAPAAPSDPTHDPVLRLGATVEPLGEQQAEALGLAGGTALAVVAVQPDSQAARAGLRANDVITAIAAPVSLGTAGGPTIAATWEALCTALDARPAGGALDFVVRRDGLTRIVHVQIEPLEQATRAVADAPPAAQIACV